MSPEAQRVAIAEACGWCGPNHVSTRALMNGWWSQDRGVWWLKPDGHSLTMASDVPDYLTDLNAMHEAERVLTTEQQPDYWRNLCRWVGQGDDLTCRESFWIGTAGSAQRAEAFLRTIGKWTP